MLSKQETFLVTVSAALHTQLGLLGAGALSLGACRVHVGRCLQVPHSGTSCWYARLDTRFLDLCHCWALVAPVYTSS
jgi:hypothetical protein